MNRFSKIIAFILFLFFIFILVIFDKDIQFIADKDSVSSLNDNWQYKQIDSLPQSNWLCKNDKDTSWKAIDKPSNFHKRSLTDVWFRRILKNWDGKDPAIFIRAIKDMAEVYIDDQLIYSTGNFKSRNKISFSGYYWHLIALPKDFAQKQLTIHIRSRHSYPGIIDDVLLGSYEEIISSIINKNFIMSFLAMLFLSSVIISVILLFLIKEFSEYKGFIILQVSMGVWIFVNLPVLQLIVNAPKIIYYLDHISMFSIAAGFILLTETIIAHRYKKLFRVIRKYLLVIISIAIVIDIVLFPYHRYIAIPFYIIIVALIIVFMFVSIKSYRIVNSTSKLFILGLNAYAIFAFIEVARYYIRVLGGSGSMDAKFLYLGGLCLFYFLTWIIISHYVNMNERIITSKERERERIARDLHDEIGPRLTEIKIVSELVKQDKVEGKNIDERLDDLYISSDIVLSTFREIIWALNPANNSLEELGAYLAQYASDFFKKAGISCRLNLPPELPDIKVPYDFRRNIIMAVKESLNNIVKHADASLATLSIKTINSNLVIEIKDDGIGFDTSDANPYGNGLKNINYRIEACGGKASVQSCKGFGTAITLQIPFD